MVYWPIFFYWLWLSLRSRSFFYFTASNPGIENGGMLGESKIKILDMLTDELKPKTVFIKTSDDLDKVRTLIQKANLNYPIICKPDIGERGWKVEKIKNEEGLILYHEQMKVDYLIQEFLAHPIEMGVFYYRYPNQKKGKVSSIVIKEMLSLIGNGESTIQELILSNDRAKLQWKALKEKYINRLQEVLAESEHIELVSIGNHCKGTKFLNGNHLISERLNDTFDKINEQIDGFFFGRYDLKVHSVEDLYQGKIKIMELNGAGSEPSHVYQPGFSLIEAYRVFFHHWRVLYEISIANNKAGTPFLTLREGISEYRKINAIEK
jgi:hypothetical protein